MSILTLSVYKTTVVNGIATAGSTATTITINDRNNDGMIDDKEWADAIGAPRGHVWEAGNALFHHEGQGNTKEGMLYTAKPLNKGQDVSGFINSLKENGQADSTRVCFTAGTLIETTDGPVAVESLRPGMMVVTRDGDPAAVRWVGQREMDLDELTFSPHLRPIRIAAGALGAGRPARDLTVSPGHRMLVELPAEGDAPAREVLIAARNLLAMPGVEVVGDAAPVTYVHFMCDEHQVVMSEGAPSETLNMGLHTAKALSPEAYAEILALFPEMEGKVQPTARPALPGAEGRSAIARLLAA